MEFLKKHFNKIILLFGCLFFAFLFFVSWVFFKERMLSFDPAFFSFLMLDQTDFSFALGRWGSVFSQALPLAALKDDCSLETFLRLYSVSPVIIYSIIFIIITIGLKNYKAGIALMLALCLGFRHAFYYTTAELYLGIALSILLWAIISPENENRTGWKKNIFTALSLLLIYTMSFLHQLTIFSIAFILISEFIGNKRGKDFHLWAISIFALVWYVIRIYILTESVYENAKIPSLEVFIEQIPKIRYLPSMNYFKAFAPRELWSLFLLIFICWIFLFRYKQWLYFVFLPVYCIAFLVLIVVTYYKGESPMMYENYYTMFGVFAAVPFTSLMFKKASKGWIIIALALIVGINLRGLYFAHEILTKRIEYVDRIVSYGSRQEKRKFLINAKNFPWQVAWASWALPFETALYSALKHPDSVCTFILVNEMDQYDTLINRNNIFLGPEWAVTWFGSQNLNNKYFHFPGTGYEKLNTMQSDSSFDESIFNKNNIAIIPQNITVYSEKDSFVVVPVLIQNTSGKRIASTPDGPSPVFLSYHLFDEEHNEIVHDGNRCVLDIDIKGNYTQGLNIKVPDKSGNYTVAVDFVSENKRWWQIPSQFILIVN